jgi:hypothetical protein
MSHLPRAYPLAANSLAVPIARRQEPWMTSRLPGLPDGGRVYSNGTTQVSTLDW